MQLQHKLESPAPYRALLVDDEPSHRLLLREILTSADWRVQEAGDGDAALEAITQGQFDLVLLDKRMPGLSGDEVCTRIRENERSRLLPVIMVTGFGEGEELALSLEAGASDLIRKPYSPAELVARATAAARHKRQLDQMLHHPALQGVTITPHASKRPAELIQRYSAILETTTVGLFGLDRLGRVTFVNNASCHMLGYKDTELMGQNHHELVHHTRPDGTAYPRNECSIMRTLEAGLTASGEDMFFHRDGYGIPVEYSCAPLRESSEIEELVVTFRDISGRRHTEEQMRLAASIIDNTQEAVMVTDPEGRILTTNRAFGEITGYQESELIGQTPRVLRSGRQDPDFYTAMWQALEREGKWQGEIINRTRSGDTFPAWLTINSVRDPAGTLTNYVAIFSDITPIKRSQEQIEHLAQHDPLTGLPNRLLLSDRLKIAVRAARRSGHSVGLLFLDLDRFKDVNDNLGHIVGDALLLEMAQRLRSLVREEDTVARLGGDEFVVLISTLNNQREIEVIAQKIVTGLARPIYVGNQELILSVSIGISLYPQDSICDSELIRHADIAMYNAKERGLNEYAFYDREMSAESERRMNLEMALRHALRNQKLDLHYQPQFDLASGELCGIEALARWTTSEGARIPPDEFIPVAELSGLIVPLGEWALYRACRQAATWLERGILRGRISVNVSFVQIRRGGLVDVVRQALQDSGLEPSALTLEITESTIMQKTSQTLEVLRELKSLGVHIAVDDFGTGYSSLSHLQNIPVDQLKVDQAFVRRLPEDTKGRAVSQAIIALGKGLGLEVIAEGVENDAQRTFLCQQGCHQGQGWLFAKAMPPSELEQLLTRQGQA
ncbi:MAG: PAS domain S-box protein [Sedimenticola sp.]|nr:MAG: PAS domain S-box protein [Sedimenticola sp.]